MRLLTIILAAMLMSGCGKTKGPPSTDSLSSYNIAGLSIDLPLPPLESNFTLPPEAKELIKSLKTYELTHWDSNTKMSINRAVYNQPEADLDGSADGAIAQVRAQPGVSDFTSSKSQVVVDGLQSRSVEASYGFKNSKDRIIQFALIIKRKNILWQIQIVGDATYSDSLRNLKEIIFGSIKLS